MPEVNSVLPRPDVCTLTVGIIARLTLVEPSTFNIRLVCYFVQDYYRFLSCQCDFNSYCHNNPVSRIT